MGGTAAVLGDLNVVVVVHQKVIKLKLFLSLFIAVAHVSVLFFIVK
jgi:hypothetical protein